MIAETREPETVDCVSVTAFKMDRIFGTDKTLSFKTFSDNIGRKQPKYKMSEKPLCTENNIDFIEQSLTCGIDKCCSL